MVLSGAGTVTTSKFVLGLVRLPIGLARPIPLVWPFDSPTLLCLIRNPAADEMALLASRCGAQPSAVNQQTLEFRPIMCGSNYWPRSLTGAGPVT